MKVCGVGESTEMLNVDNVLTVLAGNPWKTCQGGGTPGKNLHYATYGKISFILLYRLLSNRLLKKLPHKNNIAIFSVQ